LHLEGNKKNHIPIYKVYGFFVKRQNSNGKIGKRRKALIRTSDPLTVFRFAKPPLPPGARERHDNDKNKKAVYLYIKVYGFFYDGTTWQRQKLY
jgi:hypothetical protein